MKYITTTTTTKRFSCFEGIEKGTHTQTHIHMEKGRKQVNEEREGGRHTDRQKNLSCSLFKSLSSYNG